MYFPRLIPRNGRQFDHVMLFIFKNILHDFGHVVNGHLTH